MIERLVEYCRGMPLWVPPNFQAQVVPPPTVTSITVKQDMGPADKIIRLVVAAAIVDFHQEEVEGWHPLAKH